MLSGRSSKAAIAKDFNPLAAAGSAAHFAYSSATERCDQLVGRPEFARSQLGWRHRLKDLNPLHHVNAQVVFRGLDTLMAEPQGDFANVAGRLQDIERTGVPPMPSTA